MLSYNDVLDELQYYMLNEENIKKALKLKICRVKNEKIVAKESIVKNPALYIPNQQDSLFWCYYIIKNGDIKYETLNYKNSLVAKQLKIELVTTIRKNKDIVKMYKFDTISNLENNLANDNNLTPKTFLTLCAIENINIIYVCKKTYYELLMNDTNVIYIVDEVSVQSKYYNKYGFEMATDETLNNIRTTLYKIDNIAKPIKGASSYKVQDLIDICKKLSIETNNTDSGKNKTKNELYESIIQYF
jgi:hypothetical protein